MKYIMMQNCTGKCKWGYCTFWKRMQTTNSRWCLKTR